MPPRRSTRSTRPSIEPDAQLPPPIKRKRGSTTVEDEAPVAKPARSRTTRSRGSLPKVEESDRDGESKPPVKRSKASPAGDKENEEEEEAAEEVVKPKGRRTAAPRKVSATRAKVVSVEAVKEEEVKEEEEEEEKDKPSRSMRGTRATAKPSTRTSSRSKKSQVVDLSEPSEMEETVEKKSGRKASNGRKASSKPKTIEKKVVDLSDNEVPEKAQPKARGRKPAKASLVSAASDAEAVEEENSATDANGPTEDTVVPDSEAEEDLLGWDEPVPRRSPLKVRSVKGPIPDPAVSDPGEKETTIEEEEEKSLFDPPPLLPKPTAPPVHAEEPKGPTSRLVIHKMALVNFKSYAGRQEIGPFHKSFSSIVGPNGSGKSNTIDALLFVFGYRASKMRQGKLSELIHNSARYPDLDECSVEVHFREIIDLPGPDSFEVVPNSQLVVTRTATINNASKYTINSRQSSFSEVQALLKGRGIDLDHKRFLILQGEVESIAQMKPKAQTEHEDGLLEYLEDIIGTSKYKSPIEEALNGMDALSEERAEKLGRLRLVEKEKKRLEEGKCEAEDWLRMQNDWTRAQSRLLQWNLWRCLDLETALKEKITVTERDLAEETEKNKADIDHLTALEKHFKTRSEAYEEVSRAADEATKDLALHEKKEVNLVERRKHASGKAKKLRKALEDDEKAKTLATRTISESAKKMEREKQKVEEYEASLEQEEKVLEGIRDSLKDKTQVFHDQIEVKQKELQPWTAKISKKQGEIDLATSERDALQSKAVALQASMEQATETLEQLNGDKSIKADALEEAKQQKASLKDNIKAAEKKLADITAFVRELRSKASSAGQKVEEAKSSQAANTSQNKVLDTLNRLKGSGRISGFHGRLGSLGTIPEKYDVAVSTACGALNNLIVDTVEEGQSCIEYLRKQNVGRASFIVLEKLHPTHGLEKIAIPENVPRLFDLIKPKDPRFAPAFYKGVGNTLVAPDLEQANRIAFGGQRRWRVVTLAGQLIDSSGTMSGGGNSVARGGMSSKLAADTVSPETLKVYEQEHAKASEQLGTAIQELRQVEQERDDLSQSGPQIDLAIEKYNLDVNNIAKCIVDAEKRVRELKLQSKPDASDLSRVKQLEQVIVITNQKLEEIREGSGVIEGAIQTLEKKILEIGGSRLLAQKSKVDGLRLHINLANDEITKAEVAKAKAEKDAVKLELAVGANATGLEEVEQEVAQLQEELDECQQYVSDIRARVETAQHAVENSKDDLDRRKAELDAKTEEAQEFRKTEAALKQSLFDLQKEFNDNDTAIEQFQTEHDQLKLEEIDDDDEEQDQDEKEGDDRGQAAANGMYVDDESMEADAPSVTEAAVKLEPNNSKPKLAKKKQPGDVDPLELYIYSADELAKFKRRQLVADTELLDEKLKNAKPDMAVLREYRKREEEFMKRASDLDATTERRDEQKRQYDGLRKQRLDEFMAGFNLISIKLKEMYQMITLGGNAELELVDSMDPFSEGIIFSVMPPKKSWKNISNLSGGEKTLSSLALVFALHVFKPTPLYFMDEIDAALDFRNVSIVANYIKDRTKNAQFIIISLRNDMFELSHRLIGIYKTSNATQSISIDNHALTRVHPPLGAAIS